MKWLNWWHTLDAQNVVIVWGSWTVGSTAIQQILTKDRWVNQNPKIPWHRHPTRILWATSSSHMLIANPRQIEWLLQLRWGQKSIKDTINSRWEEFWGYDDIIWMATTLGIDPSDLIFVDMTADKSEENMKFHRGVMKMGSSMITANKNPISLYSPEIFRELTQQRDRYGYSASTMAGGPAIHELQKAYDTRNTVKSIEWCFSGTLAFICSELEKWGSISAIIKDAHTRKYTEPNPWDDLSGLDVARKILILARTAGYYDLTMDDILVEPFIPAEFWKYQGEEFFEELKELDTEWKERLTSLTKEWKTIRYVAELTTHEWKPKIKVGLKEVGKNSQLWSLQWTNNKVIIHTDEFTSSYERPGAGPWNTAANVRWDIAAILRWRIA